MDAFVLQPRAHGASCLRTNAGGNSGGTPFAASPVPAIALAPFERGIFSRGRDAAFAAACGLGRPRADLARIPVFGAARFAAQFEHGGADRACVPGAGGRAAE